MGRGTSTFFSCSITTSLGSVTRHGIVVSVISVRKMNSSSGSTGRKPTEGSARGRPKNVSQRSWVSGSSLICSVTLNKSLPSLPLSLLSTEEACSQRSLLALAFDMDSISLRKKISHKLKDSWYLSLENGEDGMWRPRGCILEPVENAAFLGTRNGMDWQTADKYPDPGVGVDILLDRARLDSLIHLHF